MARIFPSTEPEGIDTLDSDDGTLTQGLRRQLEQICAQHCRELQGRVERLEEEVVKLRSGQPLPTTEGEPLASDTVAVVDKDEEADKCHSTRMAELETGLEYELEASVWDAMLFTALPGMRNVSGVVVFVAFLLMLTMQVVLFLILETGGFMERQFPPDTQVALSEWRNSEGHNYLNVDPLTGVSLVARVCNLDPALSLATSQQGVYDNVVKYRTKSGALLCIVASALWSMCIAVEVRKAINFLLALFALPRHSKTQLSGSLEDGFFFARISRPRVAFTAVVVMMRIAIALMLLVPGTIWLMYETSISNLLLNASALGFVLEIDEIIFATMGPIRCAQLVKSMQPLKLPSSRRLVLIPITMITLVTVYITCMAIFFMRVNINEMREVEDRLCDGEFDFVAARDTLNRVIYSKTPSYGNEAPMVAVRQDVIHGIAFNETAGNGAETFSSTEQLTTRASNSVAEIARGTQCMDEEDHIGRKLWAATANESMLAVSGCADLVSYCHENSQVGKNVRLSCPITCGCRSPTSGMLDYYQNSAGCPAENCQSGKAWTDAWMELDCEDLSLADLQQSEGWSRLLAVYSASHQYNATEGEWLINDGCDGITSMRQTSRSTLCANDDGGGASALCPVTCGCETCPTESVPTYCPTACSLQGNAAQCSAPMLP